MTSDEIDDLHDLVHALDVDPEAVETALERVQTSAEKLHSQKDGEWTQEEIAEVRERLPTDPLQAAILQLALPQPLRERLEYVHPSSRQQGYWRRSRERSDVSQLSDAELRRHLCFNRIMQDQRGRTGTVQTSDGREVPETAIELQSEMTGQKFDDEEDEPEEHRISGRVRRLLSWALPR